MKIVKFDSAESYEPEEGWKRTSLCGEHEISVEHFVKPARHASPWHSHPNQQVLVVLTGKLVVRTDGGEQELSEGDCAFLSGGESHSVVNSADEPATGLDIFVPGRSFDFWLKR